MPVVTSENPFSNVTREQENETKEKRKTSPRMNSDCGTQKGRVSSRTEWTQDGSRARDPRAQEKSERNLLP